MGQETSVSGADLLIRIQLTLEEFLQFLAAAVFMDHVDHEQQAGDEQLRSRQGVLLGKDRHDAEQQHEDEIVAHARSEKSAKAFIHKKASCRCMQMGTRTHNNPVFLLL